GGSHEIQKIEIDHEDDMFGRICDTRSIDRTACFPCAAARRIVSSKLSPGAGTMTVLLISFTCRPGPAVAVIGFGAVAGPMPARSGRAEANRVGSFLASHRFAFVSWSIPMA